MLFTKNIVYVLVANTVNPTDDIVLLRGTREEGGLFMLHLNESAKKQALTTTTESSAEERHRKMGHLGLQNLERLTKMCAGMQISAKELRSGNKCDVCLRTKMTRESFGTDRTKATRPLEIIHTDICGPIEPKTWDNKSYFITFTDDFTGWVQTYLTNHKSEAHEVMCDYVNEVSAKHNLPVSKIRCDNGGEYVSSNARRIEFSFPNLRFSINPRHTIKFNMRVTVVTFQ